MAPRTAGLEHADHAEEIPANKRISQHRREDPLARFSTGALGLLTFVVSIAVSGTWPTPATAGMTMTHALAMKGEGAIIELTGTDVIIAEVVGLPRPVGTNGNPPVAIINVKETLRGDVPAPAEYRAVWLPFPHDVDYIGGGSKERIRRWEEATLEGPGKGAELILVGSVGQEEAFLVSPIGRFPYSKERREWALTLIEKGEIGEDAPWGEAEENRAKRHAE